MVSLGSGLRASSGGVGGLGRERGSGGGRVSVARARAQGYGGVSGVKVVVFGWSTGGVDGWFGWVALEVEAVAVDAITGGWLEPGVGESGCAGGLGRGVVPVGKDGPADRVELPPVGVGEDDAVAGVAVPSPPAQPSDMASATSDTISPLATFTTPWSTAIRSRSIPSRSTPVGPSASERGGGGMPSVYPPLCPRANMCSIRSHRQQASGAPVMVDRATQRSLER